MASYIPPSEQLPIFDNAVFESPAGSGLTLAQANLLYLRKTFPDTATAVETFSAGLLSPFMNGLSPLGNIYIADNLTSGELYLGVDAAGTNGRIGHIHIGDANNLPSGAGVHINNGTTNASNTNISNGTSTTGTVNIMTGATSNGSVNIKTGTGGGAISMGSTSGTQVIQIFRPLTLGYTIQPVTGQIGSIYSHPFGVSGSFPVPTTGVQTTGSVVNTTITIPQGVYVITATQSFNCSTAVGTTDSYNLVLRNSTLITIIANQLNEAPYTSRTGVQGQLNLSTTVYTPGTHIFTLTYELKYTGIGATYTAVSNQFNFLFCRVG